MTGIPEIIQGTGLLGIVGLIVWDWLKRRHDGAEDKCDVDYSKQCKQEITKISVQVGAVHESIDDVKRYLDQIFDRLRVLESRTAVIESKTTPH